MRSFLSRQLAVAVLVPLVASACRTPQTPSSSALGAGSGDAAAKITELCDAFALQTPAMQVGLSALLEGFLKEDTEECAVIAKRVAEAENVSLKFNEVADLSFLAALPHLRRLRIGGYGAAMPGAAAALGGLTQLTELSFVNVSLDDVEFLRNFTNLEKLNLFGTDLKSISPLAPLIQLKELQIGGNEISDLSPVKGMLELTKFAAYSNRITDLTPLMFTAQLEVVDLSQNNKLSNLMAIQYLPALRELNVSGCNIGDISPLAELGQLKHLNISSNRIKTLKPLTALPLEELNAGHNKIVDVSPLVAMTAIKGADLFSNPIGELPEFPAAHTLERMNLVSTSASNFCRLAKITGLKWVLSNNDDIMTRERLIEVFHCN